MNMRHITRFTYQFTNFQGWRVAICRQGVSLARYFSDKQYGDSETAKAHAISFRDMVLEELLLYPERTQEILMLHRSEPKPEYPAGLKPAQVDREKELPTACSMRSNHVMHGILQNICRRFHLDTASVLKLSLYLFSLHYGAPSIVAAENAPPADCTTITEQEAALPLQQLIYELESQARLTGLPSFEEFATGKISRAENAPAESFAPPPHVDCQPGSEHAASRYMRSAHPSPPAAPLSPTSFSPNHLNLPLIRESIARSQELPRRDKSLPYALRSTTAQPLPTPNPELELVPTPPDAAI